MKYRAKFVRNTKCTMVAIDQQRCIKIGRIVINIIFDINYYASSNSMEAYGAREIWCRSLAKHNSRYTIYIGDGDSSSHKGIVEARPYGDTEVKKSDYAGHAQKRMGTVLRKLVTKYKWKQVISTGEETTETKGISGKGGLTKKDIDKIQTYDGKVIRDNPGNIEGMNKSIKAIFGHYSNDHQCA